MCVGGVNLWSFVGQVAKLQGCHNQSNLKEMEMELKIVSRRDGKNIDSTENVKRGKKSLSQKKL